MKKKILTYVFLIFACIILLNVNHMEKSFADSDVNPTEYIENVKIIKDNGESEPWFKGYKIEDDKIILEIEGENKAAYFWDYKKADNNFKHKLVIETTGIEKIVVDNNLILPKDEMWGFEGGEEGIKGFETSMEDWRKGVSFAKFGFYHEDWFMNFPSFSKENPPEFTFTTTEGESFTLPWEVVVYGGGEPEEPEEPEEIKFEIIVNTNATTKALDNEVKAGVLVAGELVEGQMVELEANKEYTIMAEDGISTKFKEWKLSTNPINGLVFEDHFGEKFSNEISFTLTDALIEEIKKLAENRRYMVLEATYNEYTAVEIELKKGIEDIDSSKMLNKSLTMMEYSMETEEYKETIELLRANIENNYTHRLEDEMGEAYIILKDMDGELKEKIPSSLNEDIILALSTSMPGAGDVLELIASPKEGYEFEKWQIITPAMTIENEWDIPIDYLNPELGVSAETRSPYIKTKLDQMPNKPKGHINHFRARAIFKPLDQTEPEQIDKIEEIHREYIKGYTDVSDIFPKTVKVKLKDKDAEIAIAVDWNNANLEELTPGEHTIEGVLKDPRYEDTKAQLYLIVNEVKEILQPNPTDSVIKSNFFGTSGQTYNLPKQVEVKLFNGKSEEIRGLDIKWEEQPLFADESYKVSNGRILYYKHGTFEAVGNIKGYENSILFKLEIIPGNTIFFYIDDDFKEPVAGKYSYKMLEQKVVKKGELIPQPETPIRQGYIHLGWYIEQSGADPLNSSTGTKFNFDKPLGDTEMTGSSFTFYHKWRELFIDSVKDIEVEVDTQLTDKIKINTTEDYTVEVVVKEWKNDGLDLSKPGEYTVKVVIEWKLEDIELDVKITVKDEEVPRYAVIFNSNGGSSIPALEVDEDGKATEPENPTRDGYIFAGWYEDEGLTKVFDFETLITEDITLYAKWEENPIPETLEITSVELIKDGQLVSEGVKRGDTFTLTLPRDYSEAVDIGHILKITGTEGANLSQDRGFEGPIEQWAGGNISNSIVAGQTRKFTMSKDGESQVYYIEIKAFEEESIEYRVSFNSNGGSNISSQDVKEGDTAVKPRDPSRSGYNFIGWYMDSNLSQVFSFNTPITKDITLYAKWEPTTDPDPELNEYIVSFNTNGGSSISSQYVLEGRAASQPNAPTRSGYKFINWYTDPSLNNIYKFSTSITKDITLYAKWESVDTATDLPRILRFSLLGYEGSVDNRNERITVSLPYNIDLRNIVPNITITEGATISPSKSSAANFERTVYYTVYGANNSQKTYRVSVNMPSERESHYWDDYYENYKKTRDDYYKDRGDISWWELAKEAKELRVEEELKIKTETDMKLLRKERASIFNQVGNIESRARNSRSSLMIEETNNYIEITPTLADFKPGFANIINLPKGVLSSLEKGEYAYIKYNTGVVNIDIYPFMETASGLKLNLCDVPNDIRDKWNKINGHGYIFQVETDSTKGGLSFELNLQKPSSIENLQFVKYDYMKGGFEVVSPEKWYVFNGKLRCDMVSAGIYGILYR